MTSSATEVRMRLEIFDIEMKKKAAVMEAAINHILCGSKFYKELTWQVIELPKWTGRNWRRIKRERNKFMKAKP